MSEVYEDNNKTHQVRPHVAARFFLYGNSFLMSIGMISRQRTRSLVWAGTALRSEPSVRPDPHSTIAPSTSRPAHRSHQHWPSISALDLAATESSHRPSRNAANVTRRRHCSGPHSRRNFSRQPRPELHSGRLQRSCIAHQASRGPHAGTRQSVRRLCVCGGCGGCGGTAQSHGRLVLVARGCGGAHGRGILGAAAAAAAADASWPCD